MSVWILQLALTPDDEAHILKRAHLPLPFDHLPDLSMLKGEGACRRLLQSLYPDDPPESIIRKTDRIWKLYSGIGKEDIIAVPLPSRREVALAEVSGKYEYRVGENGADVHLIPVLWHRCFSLASFGKYATLFAADGAPMREVTQAAARTAIRDKLPRGYNRFARWKWLLVGLMGMMGMVRLLERLAHMGGGF